MRLHMKQPSLSTKERLALGKRVHEKEWPSPTIAAAELGRHPSLIYAYQREYRVSAGLLDPNEEAAIAERKKAADRERNRKNRENKRLLKLNGNSNGHLIPSPQDPNSGVRIAALERELERALEEVHTLQKLLMVAGRAL